MARAIVARFDGVGGPAKLHKEDDGFFAGPTDVGEYRVSHCGRHSSPSYPDWSRVRWGSAIKESSGQVMVMHEGKWQTLKQIGTQVTREQLVKRNLELYGKNELPSAWLFNDFGHMTCYFYRDTNHNSRFDKDSEKLHLEYFHTTPDDEASSAAGDPVKLQESHGCIHVKPKDIDAMINAGYFKAGNLVKVHGYKEMVPAAWPVDATVAAPFEVHFFPGERTIVITGKVAGKPPK
jgi:hypothetical protein